MATPMDAQELREALRFLHWEEEAFARASGISARRVRRMVRDEAPVPHPIAEWVRKLVAAHRALPPPPPPERPTGPARPIGSNIYALRPEDA